MRREECEAGTPQLLLRQRLLLYLKRFDQGRAISAALNEQVCPDLSCLCRGKALKFHHVRIQAFRKEKSPNRFVSEWKEDKKRNGEEGGR